VEKEMERQGKKWRKEGRKNCQETSFDETKVIGEEGEVETKMER